MDQKNNPAYMPYIDGLRGIAVLVILLFHIDISFFRGGFIGVDIFFVISGYLITQIITKDILAGRFSFWNFYARRMKRIFPALFAMLFFTALATIIFLGPHQYYDFFKALRMASGQISNLFFSREVDYFAIGHDHSPLLHTWSLGVEEQFYLLWPMVLLVTHKFLGLKRSLIVLVALFFASLLTSEYLVRTDAMDAFYLLHARAWELAMGGVIALNILPPLRDQKWIELASALGLSLVLYAALFYETAHFPGLKAVIPCLGAALFLYAAQQSTGMAHKMLSARALVFTGLISYSLYLWHWPVVAFYKSYFSMNLTPVVQIEMLALSFVLAYLSYRYIEQPFRHMSVPPKKVIATGLAVIVVFIVSSNIIKNENDAGWRVTYKVVENVRAPHALDKICSVEGGAMNKKDCIIGPNKDKYEVILVGDSHASHYTPAVLQWAKNNNLTVRIFLRGACRTWVESKTLQIKNGKIDNDCMDLTRSFYQTLGQDTHIRYIFLGLLMPTDSEDIRHSLEKIKTYNKTVYFLGQAPLFKDDPHECQIKNNLLITKLFPKESAHCMELDPEYFNARISASHESFLPLLKDFNIPYFNPVPFIKTPFDEEGRFMYLDSNHLNRYGALYLAPYLEDFLKAH